MPAPTIGEALGVNNDGTIIVGTVNRTHTASIYWRDGSPPTTREMGLLPGGTLAAVSAVNGDGGIAVGTGDTTGRGQCAFRWRKDVTPQMEALVIPDGYVGSVANDINNVGNIIVGYGFSRTLNAFRWTDASGTLSVDVLPTPQEAYACFANGTNDDGTTIVGECRLQNGYRHAVCWLGGGSTPIATVLPCIGDHSNAVAYAVSGDGNVIVGESSKPGDRSTVYAVRWTRTPGTNTFNIENLNVLPETPQNAWTSISLGVNHDGTVIVGRCFYTIMTPTPSTLSEAFIWREDATPQVQKLANATAGLKHSQAMDVIKRDDGTTIAVGSSFIRNSGKIAVRWNNLALENLNFPS